MRGETNVSNFRCRVPECELPEDSTFTTDWLEMALPFEKQNPSACERYAVNPSTDNVTCTAESFDTSKKIKCNDWVFDDYELTIVNQVSFCH